MEEPRTWREARNLLTTLVTESTQPLPLDQLLLAGMYELEGNTVVAEEQYQALVRDDKAPASHLEYYVSFLLRHAKAQEAEPFLTRLLGTTESAPPSERARYLLLQARCLKMQHRESEIQPLIQEFVATNGANTDRE